MHVSLSHHLGGFWVGHAAQGCTTLGSLVVQRGLGTSAKSRAVLGHWLDEHQIFHPAGAAPPMVVQPRPGLYNLVTERRSEADGQPLVEVQCLPTHACQAGVVVQPLSDIIQFACSSLPARDVRPMGCTT